GNRTTSAPISITVNNAIPFTFSLSATGVQILTQGQSTSLTITATGIAGPIEPVSFSISGLPSGATSSFSVSPCTPGCTTTLTLSTSTSTPAGQYPITVTGTADTVSQTSFTLTVSSTNALFVEKCGQPGNLSCFSFDNSNTLFYNWPTGTVCDTAFAGQTNYLFGSTRKGSSSVQRKRYHRPCLSANCKKEYCCCRS